MLTKHLKSTKTQGTIGDKMKMKKQLKEMNKYIESILSYIHIDRVWIMAKSKNNNEFQGWHKKIWEQM